MLLTKFIKVRTLTSLKIQHNYHVSAPRHGALTDSPNAQMDKTIFARYMDLPVDDNKVQVNYIWIDGSGINMRCKTRTLDFVPKCVDEIPIWSFDGSSTGQSHVKISDCRLIPVAMYKDPIVRGNNKMVLCETYTSEDKPTTTNHRQKCVDSLSKVCDHECMFGFEQEFLLLGPDQRPFGWPRNGNPAPEIAALHYCGVGAMNALGRAIMDAFYQCCFYCGIEIFGTNAEVLSSQWEFQNGPTLNIKAADDLWMSRWLLLRIAEDFGIGISYVAKPFLHLNGSGMHTNFSTKLMREDGGIKHIEEAIKKLEPKHKEHILVYDLSGGIENKKRLTGKNETSDINKFSWGIGDRSVSVRITINVAKNKKGYFEDRRPAADADPYQIIDVLVRSALLS